MCAWTKKLKLVKFGVWAAPGYPPPPAWKLDPLEAPPSSRAKYCTFLPRRLNLLSASVEWIKIFVLKIFSATVSSLSLVHLLGENFLLPIRIFWTDGTRKECLNSVWPVAQSWKNSQRKATCQNAANKLHRKQEYVQAVGKNGMRCSRGSTSVWQLWEVGNSCRWRRGRRGSGCSCCVTRIYRFVDSPWTGTTLMWHKPHDWLHHLTFMTSDTRVHYWISLLDPPVNASFRCVRTQTRL